MKALIVVLFFAIMASAAPARLTDMQWIQFKTVFGKNYRSDQSDEMRRKIFQDNLRIINSHNFEADLGKHSYRLGVNAFADLTSAEYSKMMLGFRPDSTRSSSGSTFLAPHNVELPEEVDWRKHGYVTEVKNQAHCGSCWAFSTTGSLEGQHAKKTGKLVSLSEQQLVDCSKSFGNEGCNGGLMDNAFKYIKANGGLDTETSYPYIAMSQACEFKKSNVGATVSGFVDVNPSEKDLQIAVATVGPISVAIDAGNPSFQLYAGGVYNEPRCSNSTLDHGVLLVGYGQTDNTDYWIVKNSWGQNWGMNGYILMRRNHGNMCGIATMASYPLV